MKSLIFSSLFLLISIFCFSQKKQWEKTITINTIEGYKEFLSKYIGSEFYYEAESKLIALEFVKAKEINTILSYKDFLNTYSEKNQFTDEAKRNLISLEFEKANKDNSIEGYKYFLKTYGDNSFGDQIKNNLISLEFEKANKDNSFEGYKYFLKTYGENSYSDQAKKNLIDLEYKKTINGNSIDIYRSFLTNYGDNSYSVQVSNLLIDLEFKTTKSINNLLAYNKFLVNYPNSVYNDSIWNLKEKCSYNNLMKSNNTNDFINYLEHYPNGLLKNKVMGQFKVKLYTTLQSYCSEYDFNLMLKYFPNSPETQKIKVKCEETFYKKTLISNKKPGEYNFHTLIEELEQFIKIFPNGKYVDLAKNERNKLIRQYNDLSKANKHVIVTFGIIDHRKIDGPSNILVGMSNMTIPLNYFEQIWGELSIFNDTKNGFLVTCGNLKILTDLLPLIPQKYILLHLNIDIKRNWSQYDNGLYYIEGQILTPGCETSWSNLTFKTQEKPIIEKNLFGNLNLPDFKVYSKKQLDSANFKTLNKPDDIQTLFAMGADYNEPLNELNSVEKSNLSFYLSKNNFTKAFEIATNELSYAARVDDFLNIAEECYKKGKLSDMGKSIELAKESVGNLDAKMQISKYSQICLCQSKCRLKKEALDSYNIAKKVYQSINFNNLVEDKVYSNYIEDMYEEIFEN